MNRIFIHLLFNLYIPSRSIKALTDVNGAEHAISISGEIYWNQNNTVIIVWTKCVLI